MQHLSETKYLILYILWFQIQIILFFLYPCSTSHIKSFIWAKQWVFGSYWEHRLTVKWITQRQWFETFLWVLWYCFFPYCVNLSSLWSIVADWIQTEHSCCSLWRSMETTFSFQIYRGWELYSPKIEFGWTTLNQPTKDEYVMESQWFSGCQNQKPWV